MSPNHEEEIMGPFIIYGHAGDGYLQCTDCYDKSIDEKLEESKELIADWLRSNHTDQQFHRALDEIRSTLPESVISNQDEEPSSGQSCDDCHKWITEPFCATCTGTDELEDPDGNGEMICIDCRLKDASRGPQLGTAVVDHSGNVFCSIECCRRYHGVAYNGFTIASKEQVEAAIDCWNCDTAAEEDDQ